MGFVCSRTLVIMSSIILIRNKYVSSIKNCLLQGVCPKDRNPFQPQERVVLNARMKYLPLLWLVRQLGAAVKHNDVILTLGLHTTGRVGHTPKSHISLPPRERYPSQREPFPSKPSSSKACPSNSSPTSKGVIKSNPTCVM